MCAHVRGESGARTVDEPAYVPLVFESLPPVNPQDSHWPLPEVWTREHSRPKVREMYLLSREVLT